MSTNQHIIDEILHCLADNKDILTKEHFHKEKNHILSKFREKDGPSHIAMIERYNELVKE